MRSMNPIVCLNALAGLAIAASLMAPAAQAQTDAPQVVAPPAAAAPATLTVTPAAVAKVEDPIGPIIVRRAVEIAGRAVHADDIAALKAYYAGNPDKPLWIDGTSLTKRGTLARDEIAAADDWGLNARDFILPAAPASGNRAELLEAEAKLTLAALKYARHARGGRMDPTQLGESIDRTAQVRDPKAVINELAASAAPDATLRKLHPQHPQFERLRQLYLALKSGKHTTEPPAVPVAEDAPEKPGKGKARRKAAAPKTPEKLTAQRVLMNMEQWRWMPEDLGALHVMVNIPEFTMRVVKNGNVIHTERVITGEVSKPTPIFSQDMQSVVFHPGWGVPNSIKVKELLPGLLSGRNPVARQGLRVSYRGRVVDATSIDWRSTDIRNVDIVQPPGPSNVLGVVKFLFPNKHDVYMHDTSSRSLFNAEYRAFSHGCVRVRNPVRLAEIVFEETAGWAPQRVASLIKGGSQDNKVPVQKKITVHMVHFTVTVDDAGKEHVLKDLYGHEQKIQAGLEGRASQVAKKRENLSETRAQLVQRARGNGYSAFSSGSGGGFLSSIFGGF